MRGKLARCPRCGWDMIDDRGVHPRSFCPRCGFTGPGLKPKKPGDDPLRSLATMFDPKNPDYIGDERAAAYRDADVATTGAWMGSLEFGEVLELARAGNTVPLGDYVARHPLIDAQRLYLAYWISSLSAARKKPGPSKMQPAREAANLVDIMQRHWRKENQCKQVPLDKTAEFIDHAIAVAAETFAIAKNKISRESVRDLMHNGRTRRRR